MDEHGTAGKELKTQDGDSVSAFERQCSETSGSVHRSSLALGKLGECFIWGRLNRQHTAPVSCAHNVHFTNRVSKPLHISGRTTQRLSADQASKSSSIRLPPVLCLHWCPSPSRCEQHFQFAGFQPHDDQRSMPVQQVQPSPQPAPPQCCMKCMLTAVRVSLLYPQPACCSVCMLTAEAGYPCTPVLFNEVDTTPFPMHAHAATWGPLLSLQKVQPSAASLPHQGADQCATPDLMQVCLSIPQPHPRMVPVRVWAMRT